MSDHSKVEYNVCKKLIQMRHPDPQRVAHEIVEYTNGDVSRIRIIISRLQTHEPLEFITGKAEFMQNMFSVNKNTIIPRVETEGLISIAKDIIEMYLMNKGDSIVLANIIDVGTGSGCIITTLSLLLQKYSAKIRFIATDISKKSLDLTATNLDSINSSAHVELVATDLIKDLKDLDRHPTFIVANLPYIPTRVYYKLQKSVRNFEPRRALDGGTDGLKYYKKLFNQIKEKGISLNSLFMEIDESILGDLQKSIIQEFPDCDFIIKKDYYDQPRYAIIRPGVRPKSQDPISK